MPDCIFCRVVAGSLPSVKICEDESAVAFMDIRPIQPGHVLVVPREHAEAVFDLPDAAYDAVMRMARRVGKAIQSEYSPPKVGLAVIGFDVAHAHVHVLPLLTIRDLTSGALLDGSLKNAPPAELEKNGNLLRARM